MPPATRVPGIATWRRRIPGCRRVSSHATVAGPLSRIGSRPIPWFPTAARGRSPDRVRGAGRVILSAMTVCLLAGTLAHGGEVDVRALFAKAEADGRVGTARKTVPVAARAARPGEIVVTMIAGEGKETQSPPAEAGDMVVRNDCDATGNEEILVGAAKFAQRYEGPLGPGHAEGWSTYRPRGVPMLYFTLGSGEGPLSFVAP